MLTATEVRLPKADISMGHSKRKLGILLGCFLLAVVFVEGFTRVLHRRRPLTLASEHSVQDALAIRHSDRGKQVLFAGNSLIFMDISQLSVQSLMGNGYLVHTAGINGSTYYDWQYGLRALFRRGSQPDVVVFAISPSQFLRAATVTPLVVSQLWRNQDILAYNHDLHLNLTTFTELLLERYSTFFSLRDVVRLYVRDRFLPGFGNLVGMWARPTPTRPRENQPPTNAAYLEKLSKLVREVPPDTKLVILIPPTNQPTDQAAEPFLKSAAQQLGLPVIEPVGEHQWPLSKFQPDAYHLNSSAAQEFSQLVGADLVRLLEDKSSSRTVAENRGQ